MVFIFVKAEKYKIIFLSLIARLNLYICVYFLFSVDISISVLFGSLLQ